MGELGFGFTGTIVCLIFTPYFRISLGQSCRLEITLKKWTSLIRFFFNMVTICALCSIFELPLSFQPPCGVKCTNDRRVGCLSLRKEKSVKSDIVVIRRCGVWKKYTFKVTMEYTVVLLGKSLWSWILPKVSLNFPRATGKWHILAKYVCLKNL